MICEECKGCFNYLVSEVGCFVNVKPCDHLAIDNQEKYERELKESDR